MERRNFKDPKYVKLRNAVYRRDKWKCQFPNCVLKQKKACHHVKRWADYPALRFNIDNCITLCWFHHDMVTGREAEFEAMFLRIIATKPKSKKQSVGSDLLIKLLMKKYE